MLDGIRMKLTVSRTVSVIFRVMVMLGPLGCVPPACAQGAAPPPDWSRWQPFLGKWEGGGGGQPGQGIGGFTFSVDLQGRVLLRRNSAEYPSAAGKPAFSHEDLMLVYREGDTTRAMYFDSEGHVIRYRVTFSSDSASIVYLSVSAPTEFQYRLTNTILHAGTMRILFEIARPGRKREFSRYIEATAVKKD